MVGAKQKDLTVGAKVRILRGDCVIGEAVVSRISPKQRQVQLDTLVAAQPGDLLILAEPEPCK